MKENLRPSRPEGWMLYPAELRDRGAKVGGEREGRGLVGLCFDPGPNEKAALHCARRLFCRGGQIRTDDLLLPKQARYRATLRPEKNLSHIRIADLPAAKAGRDTGLRYAPKTVRKETVFKQAPDMRKSLICCGPS